MKNKVLLFIILFLLLTFSVTHSLEKSTHRVINNFIAGTTINEFSFDNYLKGNLGFSEGKDEKINGVEAYKWVVDGGKNEDEPDGLLRLIFTHGRSNNHFHNPLKSWNEAGLNDTVWGIQYTGQSSIIWMQNANQDVGGRFSWQDARKYFHEGLTGADKSTRDSAMANTFRSLGQLMHVIQDASVPAHARNDIHIRYNYERWLLGIQTFEGEDFNKFIMNSISYDKSILNALANSLAPIPIARIIDSDQYNGSNPDVTVSNAIGLGEYANANFFSENTVFSDRFPFPAETSAKVSDYSIPDPRGGGKNVMRQYYEKIADGERGHRLATVGLLGDYIFKYFPEYKGLEAKSLDGGVYKDYAERLLPRAVGYSAGLLEYFFRGKLGVTQLEASIQIENQSSEDMEGNFTFYYEAKEGNRKRLPNGSWFLVIPAGGTSDALDFSEPDDVAEIQQYILVFRGKLGSESDAIAGQIWLKKYHWTIVVEYPPLLSDRYTGSVTKVPEIYCPGSYGAEYEMTWTDKCPDAGTMNVYLFASHLGLQDQTIYKGCGENLMSFHIGQFKKADFFSKIYYQIIAKEVYWRRVKGIYEIEECQLNTGSIAYPIDVYNLSTQDQLIPFSWAEVLVDSPQIKTIRDNLFPGKTIASAFKSNDFCGGGCGWTFPENSFSYAATTSLGSEMYTCSQKETAACYAATKNDCSSDLHWCFSVVGTIPESGPVARNKGVIISIPDIDFLWQFFEERWLFPVFPPDF